MLKIEWKPRWIWSHRFEVICPKTKKPVDVIYCHGCESFTSAEIIAHGSDIVKGELACKAEDGEHHE